MTGSAPLDVSAAPELAAILRTGHRSRFRLSEHFCERCNNRFAEVFTSNAGPILLGRSLATEGKDRQRRGYVVRYLDREGSEDIAAVSLQCQCSEHHLPLHWLVKQRGRVVRPPRRAAQPDALR
jgi:hypothetical protein